MPVAYHLLVLFFPFAPKTADFILAEAIYLSIRTNNLIQLKVKSNNY